MSPDGLLRNFPSPRTILFDSLIIFLLACGLIYKLFGVEYFENWGSIESTFIADSRMLAQQLPQSVFGPGWQPLWYCGTRFDYIYPPALRFGPALLSRATGISTARAYHLYIAVLYAFGIAAVYWLALAGARLRLMAWICAGAAALLSPSFVLLRQFRLDSHYWVPQRLHVLMAYGEGPHISSFSMLGAAIAASIVAFRSRRLVWVALAGLACALVVSNNFYGATSLAIFFPLALWAEWSGSRDNRIFLEGAGIVALAWGFCAFWLTPSYLAITLTNLKWVAEPGNKRSQLLAILYLVLVAAIAWRFGNRRLDRRWAVFVFSSTAVLLLYVGGYTWFHFQVTGAPWRLVPELDLALILLLAQTGFWCWERKRLRFIPVLLVLLALYPTAKYLRHFNSPFPTARNVDSQYEVQMSAWVHQNLPGARTMPTGSLRFWYDAWFDNAQVDGGSAQGLENQDLMTATWQITQGTSAELATLWLQVLGTDAIIVPDKISLDQYRDYPTPEKFRGALKPLFDNGHGTTVYQVPRRYPSFARVVDAHRQRALAPIRGGDDLEGLKKYVDVIEAGPDVPAKVEWHGFDSYDVNATLSPGQELLLQESYDPAWQASVDGQTLKTHPDVMGFTVVDAPAGTHTVQMRFRTPLENRLGYAAFLLTCAVFVWLCLPIRNRVESL